MRFFSSRFSIDRLIEPFRRLSNNRRYKPRGAYPYPIISHDRHKPHRAGKQKLLRVVFISGAAAISLAVVVGAYSASSAPLGQLMQPENKLQSSQQASPVKAAAKALDANPAAEPSPAASAAPIESNAPADVSAAEGTTPLGNSENAAAYQEQSSAPAAEGVTELQSNAAITETEANAAPQTQAQAEPAAQAASDQPAILDVAPEMQSDDVKKLQERLIELNYMEGDDPSGYYGSITAQSVGFFQRKHGLPRDGVAGAETQRLLFSDEAKPYTVTLEAEGLDVEHFQERLQQLGYPVAVTGYFGTETQSAVGYFQRMNGLTDDGSVGIETKDALFSDNAVPSLEQISDGETEATEDPGDEESSSSNGGVEDLIDYAKTQLGKPYVLGGKGPDVFDCSGFVYYSLNKSGYSIGYMTSGGWAGSGYTTIDSMGDLRRGDIVCFKGHVGIYLGDGNMIDSRPSVGGVVITEDIFNSSYWTSNFRSGKRIF